MSSADKFQPSWIRQAFHGSGNITNPRPSEEEQLAPATPLETSPAILARNRYGREEVLNLHPNPSKPPAGLSNCPIYVKDLRVPTVKLAQTDMEQRHQSNINSSKVMSLLPPSERVTVASGGTPGPNSPQVKASREWTPVKTSNWSKGATSGATPNVNGRGNIQPRPLGRGLSQPGEEKMSPYGQSYVPRGRGGAMAGRGASTTAGTGQINSRAQGLYDPKDPKDRPRNRLRSTSDDTEPAETDNGGGWQQPVNRFGRQNSSNAWNREDSWMNQEREGGYGQKQENGGTMPEWFEDTEEAEKPNENLGGSFDEDGRYRKENHNEPRQMQQNQWKQPPQPAKPRNEAPAPQQVQQAASSGQDPPQNNINFVQPVAAISPPQQQQQSNKKVEFFYLDPTGIVRGPFTKDQMYTWYNMSYFDDTLQVRRTTEEVYKTLGELKQINGQMTVFDYKEPVQVMAPPTLSAYNFPTNQGGFVGNPLFGGSTWNEMFQTHPQHQSFNPNVGSAFDEKAMMAEKKRYDMQKQQEINDMLLTQKRMMEEQARQNELKELEMKKQQDEMRRQYEEEMIRKEKERIEMKRQMEAMEAEKNARIEEERRRMEEKLKIAEELRIKVEEERKAELKRIEEERRRIEEENRKILDAELNKKKEEERKRRAEQAAEEHSKLLAKKAEEDAARIRQHQAALLKTQEEVRRAQEARKAAKDAEMMFNEDVWNTSKPATPAENPDSPWQTVKKVSPPQKPKAPAWSTSSQNASREKTLREIQEEEERQQAAEAREMARVRKEQENTLPTGSWSNASRTQQWVAGTVKPGKPAWGGAGIETQPAKSSINWDGPSLQAANKAASPVANNKKTPVKQSPVNAKNSSKNSAPAGDNFKQWVSKKLKDINSSLDGDVLADFLDTVENPNEVEDYVQEYLGVTKIAKDFTKEYLHKRSESRKRWDTDKDDLSSASQVLGTGTGGSQGKKKKTKGTRLIVDGSCLGFRATGDPNRVNQGEIETVGLTPGQKR